MAAGDVSVSITTADARQCAKFDGVDDKVITSSFSLTPNPSEFSISLWFKPKTTITTGSQTELLHSAMDSDRFHLFFNPSWGNNGQLKFLYYTGADNIQVYSTTTTWNANQLYHVIVSFNGSSTVMYINGSLQSTHGDTEIINTNAPYTLGIGSMSVGGYYFNGTIDEVRIYNRALTAAEVAKLYGGEHITTGLVGYWPLKEDYLDYSGNGNNGTNSGSILVTSDGPVAKAIADTRVNSSDRYFAIDVNGGKQILSGRIQEA